MTVPTSHQVAQPIPRLGTPLVNSDGTPSIPWYRFLITLWQRAGSGNQNIDTQTAVVLQDNGDGTFEAYNAVTGADLGTLSPSSAGGGPAQPQTVGASPWTFTASVVGGFLVVYAAQVELSRDSGVTWYTVTLNGGAVPMAKNDRARLTWYTTQAPTATFFPDS